MKATTHETSSEDSAAKLAQKTIVVIGNGMVGQRFCEKLVEFDKAKKFRIVTFCEEPRAAYDRVGLTSFFAHRDAEKLMIARMEWYREHGVEIHLGDRACSLDREQKIVRSQKGVEVKYDIAIMATGSYPFVPPVPGFNKQGVFVYRTIEDLNHIIEYSKKSKRCAVIGGGLLGLEAAKAAFDLGLETHVIEFAGRLMPRQIDDSGSRTLIKKIESLGVKVHLNKSTKEVHGNGVVETMEFNDGETLDVQMIIVSAGIRPRDDLAKESDIHVGPRGGITVNDQLRTSDPDIYAIGECALHRGMIYGLVAPGYEMAEIVAANLTGDERHFTGTDLSTKLKLMGCDVASFGDYEAPAERAVPLTFDDTFGGVYKKLLFSLDGTKLLGGILVGDASEYGTFSILAKGTQPLPCKPHELLVGKTGGAAARWCRCDAGRGADLLVQQRQQRGDLSRDSRRQSRFGWCREKLHASRHRLRRLYAARHRLVQRRTQEGGQGRRQSPLRAFFVVSHRAVRGCENQRIEIVRRGHSALRQRQRLRNLQAGGDVDPR